MLTRNAVEIRLHDYPQLRIAGRPVALQLKRGWGLMACLAIPPRRISRATAAALLWPDADVATGRTRLRRLVHQINAIAGLDLVTGDSDAVWIAGQADVVVDVSLTRQAALDVLDALPAAGVPDDVVMRLTRPASHAILADFSLDSDAFDQWLTARRRDQEQLVVRALQRLSAFQLRSDAPEAALRSARRLIDIDAFADAGHAIVIEALARLGQSAAVESAYDQCATLIRREFGARPSAAVEAAYVAALAQLGGRGGDAPSPASTPRHRDDLRYARTVDGAVAYATLGDAPDTLVLVPQAWSHIETALDEPRMRAALDRLAARFRVVMLDRRGAGLSERIDVPNSLEAVVEDVLAVMDRLGTRRAWLLGSAACGAAGIELAVRCPERVSGLILVGVHARGAWAPDYPWAMNDQSMAHWVARLQSGWGSPTSLEVFAPSVAGDPAVRSWWTRTLQHATSPNGIATLVRTLHCVDVRHRLADIAVPTLVLQRRGDRIVRAGAARYLADSIPGAELRLLDGDDHFFWHGDTASLLSDVIDFVDRHAAGTSPGDSPSSAADIGGDGAPLQRIHRTRSHDGVQLAYANAGQGPALIKAATWLSHLEFDWESPVWRHLHRAFSRDHQYVRYGERGCGLSDWAVADLSFEAWVRDLETVADALGVARFALLGISQGAPIAIAYAVRHPERVSRLVLHGGYARGRLIRSDSPAEREEAQMMARLAELGWGKSDPSFRQFFTSQFIPGGTREQHQWFNELERMSTSPENAARFMREFSVIDVVDLLPLVRCPVLVLHSVDDLRVPLAEGRLIAERIPGARFQPIDSGNHLLLAHETGWQQWIAAVRAFLKDD